MIFRRYATFKSAKNANELKTNFLGQHFKIHDLDFEIMGDDDIIRVIPHAETEDHVYTLPITRLRFIPSDNGTIIKMLAKPRRIDIGGPYLLMIFVCFMIIASILLITLGEGAYNITAYILFGSAIAIFAVLWFRLEQGYFDYIRKVKSWVKSHL